MRYGWALDRNEWDRVPQAVRDSTWRSVQFTSGNHVSVPEAPGVYALCVSPPGGQLRIPPEAHRIFDLLYTIIYVGKSDNLHRRFLQHCSHPKSELVQTQNCFGGKLDFWFMRLDPRNVAETEATLISCFGPIANRISGSIPVRIERAQPA